MSQTDDNKYREENWLKILQNFKTIYEDAYPKQGLENSRIISLINTSSLFLLLSNHTGLAIVPTIAIITCGIFALSTILSIIAGIKSHEAIGESISYLTLLQTDSNNFDKDKLEKFFQMPKKFLCWSVISTLIALVLFVIMFGFLLQEENSMKDTTQANAQSETLNNPKDNLNRSIVGALKIPNPPTQTIDSKENNSNQGSTTSQTTTNEASKS